jgi:hypothetical protein
MPHLIGLSIGSTKPIVPISQRGGLAISELSTMPTTVNYKRHFAPWVMVSSNFRDSMQK